MSRFAITAAAYSLIIAATFWWSSGVVEKKSLYDRYIVNVEGGVLSVSDIGRAVNFYTDVLDFSPVRKKGEDGVIGFKFNNRQVLYLSLTPGTPQRPPGLQTVILRVRNGFDKLHRALLTRRGNKAVQLRENSYRGDLERMAPGAVSEVAELPWGREFVVKDPDGNTFIFYSARRILGMRY